jgi:molybdopterin converting factor subunit 1
LLFAALKEAANTGHIVVKLPDNSSVTVEQFLQLCAEQHPELARWVPHVRVAINCEYASLRQMIGPGDEIALLPPVSGG